MTPEAALSAALQTAFGADPPARLGAAVSGGSDSTALMVLLADWAAPRGTELLIATVDHGLRPEAAAEAAAVARSAALLGVPHRTLRWQAPAGSGNLQQSARRGRYGLLTDWARTVGLGHVCLGHTADDQAETVLLHLARGSGVDGLAAMPVVRRDADGPVWLRPLLDVRRGALRNLLRQRGLGWAEDPGNSDARYDRVRARQVLSDPPLPGLSVPRLAATARRMAAARAVLGRTAAEAAETLVLVEAGEFVIPAADYFALDEDTRWRLLAGCLCTVSGARHKPRFSALLSAEAALQAGRRATLHGCLCIPRRGTLRIGREPAALRGVSTTIPGIWDRRWAVDGPAATPDGRTVSVAALNREGAAHLGIHASATGLPAVAVAATPAVWAGPEPLAAPVLRPHPTWQIRLLHGREALLRRLLSD